MPLDSQIEISLTKNEVRLLRTMFKGEYLGRIYAVLQDVQNGGQGQKLINSGIEIMSFGQVYYPTDGYIAEEAAKASSDTVNLKFYEAEFETLRATANADSLRLNVPATNAKEQEIIDFAKEHIDSLRAKFSAVSPSKDFNTLLNTMKSLLKQSAKPSEALNPEQAAAGSEVSNDQPASFDDLEKALENALGGNVAPSTPKKTLIN